MSESVNGTIEVQVWATAYVEDGVIVRVVVEPTLDLDFAHYVTVRGDDGHEYRVATELGGYTLDDEDVIREDDLPEDVDERQVLVQQAVEQEGGASWQIA